MIKNPITIIICLKIIIIFKFKFFERKISSEISFVIEQSKVATCRYNQELSIEKEEYDYQQIEKDENINDEKNLIESSKSNEYEEIIVTSSFTNLQSMENYNDETVKNLLKTSINCKLGML